MSYSIKGTTINLTRGDTFMADIKIFQQNGDQYVPIEGDTIRFALKKAINNTEVLIEKDIPISTMMLVLNPEDTKKLEFGKYIYDIQLTKASGEVDTFITKSVFILDEEVD